jgi:hypothetical protein
MVCEYLTSLARRVRTALANPREWLTWRKVARVGYWVLVRVYGLMLILFMLAIWQLSGMRKIAVVRKVFSYFVFCLMGNSEP